MLTETLAWECDLCHRQIEGERIRVHGIGQVLQCTGPPRGWSWIAEETWPLSAGIRTAGTRLLCDEHKIEFVGEIPT